MNFLSNTNIDFISKRKIAFIFSALLIVAGIISIVLNGGMKLGIDFTGGTLLEFDFTPSEPTTTPLEIQNIRDVLSQKGFSDAVIQEFGNPNIILVKIKASEKPEEDEDILISVLREEFPDYAGNKSEIEFLRRSEHVGAKIGEELRGRSALAILIALLGIIIYIWWRFELTFGFAAVLALFHDVIITLGLLSLFGMEISIAVIGALLAIVGYSLNDTIVLFVRIREDLKIYRKESYTSIINHSINEVLSRTVITSFTTLMVVLSLYIFGGEVIRDFAFTLLCGVLVGTYSSIFIASPVLVAYRNWKSKHSEKKRRRI
ncbi:MAG TPA: protein translocase subunit SecF [Candidatus Cloacimonetes bacterium]|nr:protein translocase subunit SecF [Candidatus Cloacimonadota bacterium]HEX37641.1 protein translocase subunit SecF [Candidatus Cloacimonadota bacterium]